MSFADDDVARAVVVVITMVIAMMTVRHNHCPFNDHRIMMMMFLDHNRLNIGATRRIIVIVE